KVLKTSRRDFLKIAVTTGGGLFLGFHLSSCESETMVVLTDQEVLKGALNFNSYLSVSPDGHVVIFSPNPELGQNIKTSFPMIVAEELDADWSKVRVVQANLETDKFDRQVTGGSGAMPHSWERLRKAGATARHMLVEAAAKRWEVPIASLSTADGEVIHKESGRKLSYGELANEAAKIEVPTEVKLKERKDFTIIGSPVKNVDNQAMFTGKPMLGFEFYREGILNAMMQRPPVGMKLKSVVSDEAKGIAGIVDIVTFNNNVAVVGKSTWPIIKARKLLKIEYEPDG